MQMCAMYCGNQMLSLSLNGNINHYTAESPHPVRVTQGHQTAISCVTVNRTTGLVYTGSTDGVICSTDSATGLTTRLTGPSSVKSICGGIHTGKVVALVVCNDAQLLSVGWDDKLRSAGLDTHEFSTEAGCAGQPSAVACAGDLTVVASGNDVGLFVSLGAERIGGLTGLSYLPTCLALVADGSEVAVGGDDNKTHVYSIADGVLTESGVVETRSVVTAVAYHPNNQVTAYTFYGNRVYIFLMLQCPLFVRGLISVYSHTPCTFLSACHIFSSRSCSTGAGNRR